MVAVRLVKPGQEDLDWKQLEVSCYVPTFLGAEGNHKNIERRLTNLFFKQDPTIIKIWWQFKDSTESFCLDRP